MLTTQFPKSTALQAMDIVIKIEEALIWHTGNTVALCIQNACQKKYPANTIIRETKEMIADNQPAMEFILGQKLVHKIKAFEL